MLNQPQRLEVDKGGRKCVERLRCNETGVCVPLENSALHRSSRTVLRTMRQLELEGIAVAYRGIAVAYHQVQHTAAQGIVCFAVVQEIGQPLGRGP